jgi:NADH dehydrogenase
MPGNRVRVAADWLLDAVLPRQAVQLGLVRSWSVPLDTASPELARVAGAPEHRKKEGSAMRSGPGAAIEADTEDRATPDEPAKNQPGGEPAKNQPGGEPAKNQPGGEPARNQPGPQPAKNQPGGEPAKNQPGGEPAEPPGPVKRPGTPDNSAEGDS